VKRNIGIVDCDTAPGLCGKGGPSGKQTGGRVAASSGGCNSSTTSDRRRERERERERQAGRESARAGPSWQQDRDKLERDRQVVCAQVVLPFGKPAVAPASSASTGSLASSHLLQFPANVSRVCCRCHRRRCCCAASRLCVWRLPFGGQISRSLENLFSRFGRARLRMRAPLGSIRLEDFCAPTEERNDVDDNTVCVCVSFCRQINARPKANDQTTQNQHTPTNTKRIAGARSSGQNILSRARPSE
jgi:hypothetical protein